MRTVYLSFVIVFLAVGILSPVAKAQDPNNPDTKTQTTPETRVRQQNEIFPNIKPIIATYALSVITSYANQLDLQPLEKNHMRLFDQPRGIVLEAVDVNLVTGDLTLYPGTHDKGETRKTIINSKDLAELNAVLTSEEFFSVPQQNRKIGADGSSYIIEVDVNDTYLWKIHWATDDPNLINTIFKINSICSAAWIESYARQSGLAALKTNHVRLFSDARPSNTYSVTVIDLTTGKLIRYRQEGIRQNTIDATDISRLKQMLTVEEFKSITPDSQSKSRADGSVYLIEYDIDGYYFRKIMPSLVRDDEPFNNVIQHINSLVYKN